MLSRVADSLYWMSRYIERAENDARILDVNLQLLLDLGDEAEAMQHWTPVIASLEETDLFDSLYDMADERSVTEFLTLQKKNPNSIFSCLTLARENARTTRALSPGASTGTSAFVVTNNSSNTGASKTFTLTPACGTTLLVSCAMAAGSP